MVLVEYTKDAGVGRVGRLLYGLGLVLGGSRDNQKFFSRLVAEDDIPTGKVLRISRPDPIAGMVQPEIDRLTRLAIEAGFSEDEVVVEVDYDRDYLE
jgi:hypothetical protein